MTDEMVTFKNQCVVCHTVHTIEVSKERYDAWQGGRLIQEVWPDSTSEEREIMISGTCPGCFNILFPADE
jgi:hypothetical protein